MNLFFLLHVVHEGVGNNELASHHTWGLYNPLLGGLYFLFQREQVFQVIIGGGGKS